ncbi:MAG: polyprenyl synthetase family protein [Phycisphaerales bacterium]|nr:MAG: polyprenyl synthetase family protein [Phycisphaerales bacterium]
MQLPAYTDVLGDTAPTGIPPFRLIKRELGEVRGLIKQQLAASAKAQELEPLLSHVRARCGKMIRPGLVLVAGMCCGTVTEEHLRVAATVELMHNATLLHDDVIDEGKQRRGLPTVNRLWGNEPAVLLGDFVLGRVFMMCADMEPRIAKVVAAIAGRVCEGELRQVVQRENWQLSESEHIDIITEKSAAFFSGCCHLGAVLAGAAEVQTESLASFGLNAGIAFQITDDLLDITGDETQTGKTAGSDADKSKLTLATIHLLRQAGEKETQKVRRLLCDGAERKHALLEMLRFHGSLEYASRQAQEFVNKATQALSTLPSSDAKDALIETARYMAGRKL